MYSTVTLCTVQYLYLQYSIFMYSAVFFLPYSIFIAVQYLCVCSVQYFYVQYSTSLYLTVIAVIIRNSGMTAAFYLLLSIKGYRFFIVKQMYY